MKTRLISLFLVLALLAPSAHLSIALEGGTTEKENGEAEPFDYSSLYVSDDQIISFSAYEATEGDAPTSLTDDLGNLFTVGDAAIWGNGVLLNRGTTVDFTAAQGTRLNDSSYTYEFVLGYEDPTSITGTSTKGGAFDVGYLTCKVPATLDGSEYTYAYSPIKNGTGTTWVSDFGAYIWTKTPFIDAEDGNIIELTHTGELGLDTSTGKEITTIAFSIYREGEFVANIANNASCPYFEYVPTLSFKFGKNLNMRIYAVRAYSDVLTESEISQNHFADVAAYYSLDLRGYLALSDVERAKVNDAFRTVRIDKGDATVQEYLDILVSMKGELAPIRFEKALSFDGYAVSLWSDPNVRAEFSIDRELLSYAHRLGTSFELGGVILPKDAVGDPIRFDETSNRFVTGAASYRQTVSFNSDIHAVVPDKVTVSPNFSREELLLYQNDEYVFRAYIALKQGNNTHVIYFDTESQRFGDAVSVDALFDCFLREYGYAQPSFTAFFGDDLIALRSLVDAELQAVKDALAAAEKAADSFTSLEVLAADSFALSQESSRAQSERYSDAATAYIAYSARKNEIALFSEKLTALETALLVLDGRITALLTEDAFKDKAVDTDAILALFREKLDALAAYGALFTTDETLLSSYEEGYAALKAVISCQTVKTLNARPLENHVLFADENDAATSALISALSEKYGVTLPLVPQELYDYALPQIFSIALDGDRAHTVYGESLLAPAENGIAIYGNAENALYHGTLKLLSMLDETDSVSVTDAVRVSPEEVLEKTYAVDRFFNRDGTLDTDSTEPLTIACIGGSLTEFGDSWVQEIKAYFEKRFPSRPVTVYNVGVGGTPSELGAARFAHQVLEKNPDLVIIEFSVNDTLINANPHYSQQYIESMLYQCLQRDKIPGVILAHTPLAVDKDDESYARWQKQVEWKNEIALHYGVGVVNIYDYFYCCYEEKAAETNDRSLTYFDYISDIYSISGGVYNVHPIVSGRGYQMYADAFITAFEENLPSFLTRLKYTDVLSKNESTATASYEMIPQDSERITYEGTWEVWTKDNRYNNKDKAASLSDKCYTYPFLDAGVRRSYKQSGTAFSFKTTATDLAFYHYTSSAGSVLTVYVDGVSVGTIKTKNSSQHPNLSSSLSLGNPSGKEVTVRVIVAEPTASQYIFQFGYIVEIFKPNK